jgi:hypothetical protein
MSSFFAVYPVLTNPSGGGSGVSSVNGATGALDILPGAGISVTTVGTDVTITNIGAGGETVTNWIYTLTPTDIANGYAVMSSTPSAPTLALLTVIGGPMQQYGPDYVVSGNHVSWAAESLQGVLVAGDVIIMESY